MEGCGVLTVHTWTFCTLLVFSSLAGVTAQTENSLLPLYPYGLQNGDQNAELGAAMTEVTFPFPLRFYGQTFEKAYISIDGVVSFDSNFRYYDVVDWKEGVPNLSLDLPFLAPFHYNGFVPADPATYDGKIYFKKTERDSVQESIDFLNKLDSYLNRAVVGVRDFRSKLALVVTWENVTTRTCGTKFCPSNTFQVVLVANEQNTFAIFNYFKMNISYDEHHLAGMNGGNRRGWKDIVACDDVCQKRYKVKYRGITFLQSGSGSDVQGRYIMRIDDDAIIRGGCIPTGLDIAAAEVYPQETGMFGGQMLSVSGECHTKGSPIYCRFAQDDNLISDGRMESEFKGRCPVPLLTTRGWPVTVELSTDRTTWKHKTFITVVLPSRLPSPVRLSAEETEKWLSTNPDTLTVGWNASRLTTRTDANVEINLIGYREHGDRTEFKLLRTIAQDVHNADGQFKFDPAGNACETDCDQFEIGMMQIKLKDEKVDALTVYQAINYGPIPLGWYVNSHMTKEYGSTAWPEAKCEAWDNQDRKMTSWLEHLLPCPCTLSQALADWGRWQPDMGCNMYSGSVCRYHTGAKHCVRSVHPSPDGAGNQCCYEQDGSLRYAADTFEGSTPDASHDWGSAPYGAPGMVPSLSHWIKDVVTFYYCCLWTNPEKGAVCKHYMDRRPTKDCVHYVPPASAAVYGDPHITTFDGTKHYFGGEGDFWLLKSDLLNVQGKFQETPKRVLQVGTKLNPTVLTSVVMWRPGRSDAITISLAPLRSSDTRKLDVRLGYDQRFFQRQELLWQDFRGVSVVNNAPTAEGDDDKKHSNFTVLFDGGAGVQVAERQGMLHVIVSLPPPSGQSPTRTQGLLGTWDGDASNDFLTPSGSTVPTESSGSDVYNRFSIQWAVSKSDNMFHFPTTTSTKEPYVYQSPVTDVQYTGSATRPSQSDLTRVCASSSDCKNDYLLTLDENIARATRKTEGTFENLQASQTIIKSCGLLDIPMASKSSTNYGVGSQVTVSSCRPDNSALVSGDGAHTYTCTTSGPDDAPYWDPAPDPTLCGYFGFDESPNKASDVGLIVGIAVAVVVAVAVAAIVAIVLWRRRKSDSRSPERPVPAKRTLSGENKGKRDDEEIDEAFLKNEGSRGPIVKMSKVRKSEPV